jgi:hypothetical protein
MPGRNHDRDSSPRKYPIAGFKRRKKSPFFILRGPNPHHGPRNKAQTATNVVLANRSATKTDGIHAITGGQATTHEKC